MCGDEHNAIKRLINIGIDDAIKNKDNDKLKKTILYKDIYQQDFYITRGSNSENMANCIIEDFYARFNIPSGNKQFIENEVSKDAQDVADEFIRCCENIKIKYVKKSKEEVTIDRIYIYYGAIIVSMAEKFDRYIPRWYVEKYRSVRGNTAKKILYEHLSSGKSVPKYKRELLASLIKSHGYEYDEDYLAQRILKSLYDGLNSLRRQYYE